MKKITIKKLYETLHNASTLLTQLGETPHDSCFTFRKNGDLEYFYEDFSESYEEFLANLNLYVHLSDKKSLARYELDESGLAKINGYTLSFFYSFDPIKAGK